MQVVWRAVGVMEVQQGGKKGFMYMYRLFLCICKGFYVYGIEFVKEGHEKSNSGDRI